MYTYIQLSIPYYIATVATYVHSYVELNAVSEISNS